MSKLAKKVGIFLILSIVVMGAGNKVLFADTPGVSIDTIGNLEFESFPQTINVTGTISHSPNIESISELKLFVNGSQVGTTQNPSGTSPSGSFSFPWTISSTGTYSVQVTAKHGGSTGNDTEGGIVITQAEPENNIPVITLLGNNPMEVEFGSVFSDPGATANDTEDGNITGDIVVGGDIVDTNTPGEYVITYNVQDSDGASAVQVTRTVTVLEDEPPVICEDEEATNYLEEGECTYDPYGVITAPTLNQLLPEGIVNLTAEYFDGDEVNDDTVNWAVRTTCEVSGNTQVAGNVGGFNDSYSWDGNIFSAAVNLLAGDYCFAFNPTDDGEVDVRESRTFSVFAPDTTAPELPVHVSPADGSTSTTALLTEIQWSDVTDPSSPVTYFYESATNPALNEDGSFVSPIYQSGALSDSSIATAGTPEGTYYWHVRAVDSEGNSTLWTTPWQIIVDNTVPPVEVDPTGEITAPTSGQNLFPGIINFTANYDDGDEINDDIVQWAVRSGSCSSATIAGNVDGFNNSFNWDGSSFSTTVDMSTSTPGSYCFVFNPADDGDVNVRETVTFNIVEEEIELPPTDETFVIRASDLGNGEGDWFFYNDETDIIDNGLGSFVIGPATAPLGAGSAQLSVSGSERKNLATYQFSNVLLEDISILKFSTYNPIAGNGGSENRSGYIHFNVDFNGTDTWQSRLVYVPRNNNPIEQNTWQEWNAADESANWSYSGATWPTPTAGAFEGQSGVSGSTLKTWAQIKEDYPGIKTRTTDSFFGIRVGEPYADGYTENIDKIIVKVNNDKKTFDFEPTIVEAPTENDQDLDEEEESNRRSASRRGGEVLGAFTSGDGEVLGASTGICEMFITDYMKQGANNNPEQVSKLQKFLTEQGYSVPVTGFYGPLTTEAVKKFQQDNAKDILQPWIDAGVVAEIQPTGIVYKMTRYFINNKNCAGSEVKPTL